MIPSSAPGGTFALYTLISRHAKVSLIPNQQVEDELVSKYNHDKPPATLQRAEWMKELLETNKTVKISLFLITMLATAMVISDAILTPAISGKKRKTYLEYIIWITVYFQASNIKYNMHNLAWFRFPLV
jgi:KUP system potassium uptake protein